MNSAAFEHKPQLSFLHIFENKVNKQQHIFPHILRIKSIDGNTFSRIYLGMKRNTLPLWVGIRTDICPY
jgi:hypothetical protein